jgi:molybdopterin converting factor small subunit
MARLRLFANLRELAGTGSTEIDGSTVGEVLDNATGKWGKDFERALEPAQVWVDGDKANRDSAVGPGSEVAVIPPVSGGAMVVQSPIIMEIGIVAAFFFALFIANHLSLQWFAVVTVFVSGIWAFDLAASAERRGLPVASPVIVLAAGAGAIATYRFGAIGMASATVGAVLAILLWSVMRADLRPIDSFAAGGAVAFNVALGASAFVLLRLRSREETLVFLFVMTVALFVSWLSDRSEMPILDPLVALIIGAVLAGAIGGALWAPNLLDALAASVAAAIALVAGRNLGTLVRAGGFFAQGPIPGSLAYFDGAFMAAGAFWAMITILS